jgi:hypothetical protein
MSLTFEFLSNLKITERIKPYLATIENPAPLLESEKRD